MKQDDHARRSMRSINPDDKGYTPSPAIERIMDTLTLEMLEEQIDNNSLAELAQSELGTYFQTYVADVLDQYTAHYYADDEPGEVTLIASRLSQLALPIFSRNLPEIFPDPTTIEAMFDDVYTMDGRNFCTKYDILEFYEMCLDQENSAPPHWDKPYQDLIHHLDPIDPARARHRVDQAILDLKRAEAKPRNRNAVIGIATYLVALSLHFPPLIAIMAVIDPSLERFPIYGQLGTLGWPINVALLVAAVVLISASLELRYPSRPPPCPPPPAFIKAWFDRHDKPGYLQYWHIYWPSAKLWVHRREGYFFDFWRKDVASRADYEKLIAKLERRRLFGPKDNYMAKELRQFLATNDDEYP